MRTVVFAQSDDYSHVKLFSCLYKTIKSKLNSLLKSDLKLDNVVLDRKGHCKIIDFGVCLSISSYYFNKDFIKKFGDGFSYDFKKLRKMTFQMFTGVTLLNEIEPTSSDKLSDMNAVRVLKDDEHKINQAACQFVNDLLEEVPFDGLDMPSTKEYIKKHSFFKNLDWTKLANGQLTPPFIPNVVYLFYLYSNNFSRIEQNWRLFCLFHLKKLSNQVV